MANTPEFESKSDTIVASSPHWYGASTSPGVSDSMQSKRSSPGVLDSMQSKRSSSVISRMRDFFTVQSHIRDLVIGPDPTPSSVISIVNTCTAVLSALRFSSLLQSRNISGHSAIYWAIVNNRQEAISAFMPFLARLSSHCRSELRQACIVTSNHALFVQLELSRSTGSDNESLRRLLGCPRDEIEVYGGYKPSEHQFIVLFHFKMFQKRLRMKQNITSQEFVGGGRIWWVQIKRIYNGRWTMEWGLRGHSPPAHPVIAIVFDPKRKWLGHADPAKLRWEYPVSSNYLVHQGNPKTSVDGALNRYSILLSECMMDKDCPYINNDGTLDMRAEVTLT